MTTVRRFLAILTLILLAIPAFTGGGTEADPENDSNESAQPSAADEETADAGASVDTASITDPTVLDSNTADLLFELGAVPFKTRIPSENFVLASVAGGDLALEDHRGQVIFLNFWATWCAPCREEMPSMQVLYDELSDEGLEIIAVNVLETEELASAFVDELELTFPVVLDRDGRVSLRYSIRAYPTSYIIDRAGNVIAVRQGFHDWSSPEMLDGFRTLLAL